MTGGLARVEVGSTSSFAIFGAIHTRKLFACLPSSASIQLVSPRMSAHSASYPINA